MSSTNAIKRGGVAGRVTLIAFINYLQESGSLLLIAT